MRRLSTLVFTTLLTLFLGCSALAQPATPSMDEMAATPADDQMGGMDMHVDAPQVPAVVGYAEGEEIHFLHTEASDEHWPKRLRR